MKILCLVCKDFYEVECDDKYEGVTCPKGHGEFLVEVCCDSCKAPTVFVYPDSHLEQFHCSDCAKNTVDINNMIKCISKLVPDKEYVMARVGVTNDNSCVIDVGVIVKYLRPATLRKGWIVVEYRSEEYNIDPQFLKIEE